MATKKSAICYSVASVLALAGCTVPPATAPKADGKSAPQPARERPAATPPKKTPVTTPSGIPAGTDLGLITVGTSVFDGATIVEMTPNILLDAVGRGAHPVRFGVRWSSAAPQYVAMILSYSAIPSDPGSAYVGLSGIDIDIDGEVQSFTSGTAEPADRNTSRADLGPIYLGRSHTVVVPYDILERMVAAVDCHLRFRAARVFGDARFSFERMPDGQATAIQSVRAFLEKVHAATGKN